MEHFDLCVIGSGSGNSLIDERFADVRVALVDSSPRFGGTCLNHGCIPTKMFVLPADLASSPREAQRLGVDLSLDGVRWRAVRDRIFGRVDAISEGGLQWREQSDNVTVFRREASFVDPYTVQLAGEDEPRRIAAAQFVLAAGSRPRVPRVPGIDDPRVHTSDTIMRIDELPERLVILGAGFIAAEFAHVFSAFGVEVTVVHRGSQMLRHEDETIAQAFTDLLDRRVHTRFNQAVRRIDTVPDDHLVVVTADENGVEYEYPCDLVLNATGRVPNSDRLNLLAAGVTTDAEGFVRVDEHQRTNVDHIWAFGDVAQPAMLKHVANHEMRVVQHNLLHPDVPVPANQRFIPHAVFSDPQIGSVGATEDELRRAGTRYVSAVQQYGSVAYGWALEDADHLVKLLADPDTGQLLGAHVLGPQAASLVQLCVQAMATGVDVHTMARGQYWIHPALTEVIENALLALPAACNTGDHVGEPGTDA